MRIPAGATIIANAWGMLQDPQVHKSPSTFAPNRFIGPAAEPNPEDVIFGFGRRYVHLHIFVFPFLRPYGKPSRCPGIAVAQSSIWLSIALTLAAYNVTPVVGSDGRPILPSLRYSNATVRSVSNVSMSQTISTHALCTPQSPRVL